MTLTLEELFKLVDMLRDDRDLVAYRTRDRIAKEISSEIANSRDCDVKTSGAIMALVEHVRVNFKP